MLGSKNARETWHDVPLVTQGRHDQLASGGGVRGGVWGACKEVSKAHRRDEATQGVDLRLDGCQEAAAGGGEAVEDKHSGIQTAQGPAEGGRHIGCCSGCARQQSIDRLQWHHTDPSTMMPCLG